MNNEKLSEVHPVWPIDDDCDLIDVKFGKLLKDLGYLVELCGNSEFTVRISFISASVLFDGKEQKIDINFC